MNLILSKELLDVLPFFSVICYTFERSAGAGEGAGALEKSALVDQLIEDCSKDLCEQFTYEAVTSIPKLKETRDGYKKLGKDPSHTRPASEALLRRILKGNGLYRLGDVIDLGNILSLMTLRSVCVVDLDKLSGDIFIRLGKVEDKYEGIGRGLINVTNLPVYTDDLGAFGCPTSDTNRSKITETTKRFLCMIICFSDNEKEEDEQKLLKLYQTYGKVINYNKINVLKEGYNYDE